MKPKNRASFSATFAALSFIGAGSSMAEDLDLPVDLTIGIRREDTALETAGVDGIGKNEITYRPVSELNLSLKPKGLPLALDVTLNLDRSDLFGSAADQHRLRSATLGWYPAPETMLKIGLLGDVAKTGGPCRDEFTPAATAASFCGERMENIVGASFAVKLPLGEHWSFKLRASGGRNEARNFTRIDAIDYLNDNDINYAPFIRNELLRANDKIFIRASQELTGLTEKVRAAVPGLLAQLPSDTEIAGNVDRGLDLIDTASIFIASQAGNPIENARRLEQAATLIDNAATLIAGRTGQSPDALLRARDAVAQIGSAAPGTLDANAVKTALTSFGFDLRQGAAAVRGFDYNTFLNNEHNHLQGKLAEARIDAIDYLNSLEDPEIRKGLEKLLRIAEPFIGDEFVKPVSGTELGGLILSLKRAANEPVNARDLGSLIGFLREAQAGSSSFSYAAEAAIERKSPTGFFAFGLGYGEVRPDERSGGGTQIADTAEKFASFWVHGDHRFGDARNIQAAVDMKAFAVKNYLNLQIGEKGKISYGLASLSGTVAWSPVNHRNLTVHYTDGVLHNVFFGAAREQEIGLRYNVGNTGLSIHGALGRVKPLTQVLDVDGIDVISARTPSKTVSLGFAYGFRVR